MRDPVGKMLLKEGTRDTETATVTKGLAFVLWRRSKNAERSAIFSNNDTRGD